MSFECLRRPLKASLLSGHLFLCWISEGSLRGLEEEALDLETFGWSTLADGANVRDIFGRDFLVGDPFKLLLGGPTLWLVLEAILKSPGLALLVTPTLLILALLLRLLLELLAFLFTSGGQLKLLGGQ